MVRRSRNRKIAEREMSKERGRSDGIVGTSSTDREGRRTESVTGDRMDGKTGSRGSGAIVGGSGDGNRRRKTLRVKPNGEGGGTDSRRKGSSSGSAVNRREGRT